MGVGADLYMYGVVVKKFTFAISSPDEFLLYTPSRCKMTALNVLRICGSVCFPAIYFDNF